MSESNDTTLKFDRASLEEIREFRDSSEDACLESLVSESTDKR